MFALVGETVGSSGRTDHRDPELLLLFYWQ